MRKLALLILALLLCVLAYPQDTIAPATQNKSAKQKEATVLICLSENAYAYHSRKCSALTRCKAETKRITETDAKQLGRTRCKICYK